MKKLMKLMCVFALVFVAGCGASSSTDEQKEVVTNFFDYVKECDITKLKKVASEDVLSGMDLEKMEKELSHNLMPERISDAPMFYESQSIEFLQLFLKFWGVSLTNSTFYAII